MPNYKEVTGSGTMWTRCYQIVINNPYGGLVKSARFFEENVVTIDSTIMQSNRGFIDKTFDPAALIELRDPSTGDKTGQTITQGELYNILYSLYMNTAIERDNFQP